MTGDEVKKQEKRLLFVNENTRGFRFSAQVVNGEKATEARLIRHYGRDLQKVVLRTEDAEELADVVTMLRAETVKRLLTEP